MRLLPTGRLLAGTSRPADRIGRHRQGGMSLVELLVGITVGLFIIAAATLMTANHLSDNRRLILETQLQQDMRATMDIITRTLRRSGTRRRDEAVDFRAGQSNPGRFFPEYTNIVVSAGNDEVTFDYYVNPESDTNLGRVGVTNWGFRLASGRISSQLGFGGGWQELTDPNTMTVTTLSFVEQQTESAVTHCPKLCADTTTACWPRGVVRTYSVVLQAQSAIDANVTRRMQSTVRVRNNLPAFNDGSTNQPCPA